MRLPRPCLDCGTLTTNPTRCTPCSTAYTSAHRLARRAQGPDVEAGLARCSRCGQPIYPGEAWDTDRYDDGHGQVWAPAHRACNRAPAAGAGGRG
jgi:hypothetical protein